jgi:hypothetical protein
LLPLLQKKFSDLYPQRYFDADFSSFSTRRDMRFRTHFPPIFGFQLRLWLLLFFCIWRLLTGKLDLEVGKRKSPFVIFVSQLRIDLSTREEGLRHFTLEREICYEFTKWDLAGPLFGAQPGGLHFSFLRQLPLRIGAIWLGLFFQESLLLELVENWIYRLTAAASTKSAASQVESSDGRVVLQQKVEDLLRGYFGVGHLLESNKHQFENQISNSNAKTGRKTFVSNSNLANAFSQVP